MAFLAVKWLKISATLSGELLGPFFSPSIYQVFITLTFQTLCKDVTDLTCHAIPEHTC